MNRIPRQETSRKNWTSREGTI